LISGISYTNRKYGQRYHTHLFIFVAEQIKK